MPDDKPTVFSHSYVDYESGETVTVYWIEDRNTGAKIYTDENGNPK